MIIERRCLILVSRRKAKWMYRGCGSMVVQSLHLASDQSIGEDGDEMMTSVLRNRSHASQNARSPMWLRLLVMCVKAGACMRWPL